MHLRLFTILCYQSKLEGAKQIIDVSTHSLARAYRDRDKISTSQTRSANSVFGDCRGIMENDREKGSGTDGDR